MGTTRSRTLLPVCLLLVVALCFSAPASFAIGQVNGLHFIGQVNSSFTGTLGLDGPGGQSADCTYVNGVLQGSPCDVAPGINEGVWTITASGTGAFGLTVALCKLVPVKPSGPCAQVLGDYATFAFLDFCGGSQDLCNGSFTGQFRVNDVCNTSAVGCLVPVANPVPESPLPLTMLVALGLPLMLLTRRLQRPSNR